MIIAEFYCLENEIIEKNDNPTIPFKRHIFYTVDIQKEEAQIVEEIEKVIGFDEPAPPEWWLRADTLRFVYEFEWDFNIVCDVIFW